MQKIVAVQPSRNNEPTVPRKASCAWMETVSSCACWIVPIRPPVEISL